MNELRTFESVARLRSISKAALKLNCSQPCVSQRLQSLEQRWSLRLFHRNTRDLEWSESTQVLYEVVQRSLNDIEHALATVVQEREQILTMSVSEDFASGWLEESLERFHQQHRRIRVKLYITNRFVDLTRESIDVALRLLPADVRLSPDLQGTELDCGDYLVVTSPAYLAKYPNGLSKGNIGKATLLTERFSGSWDHVLAGLDFVPTQKMNSVAYATQAQALEAAQEGKGLAIARRLFVSRLMSEGQLVLALPTEIVSSDTYYFVHSRHVVHKVQLATLYAWLVEDIAASVK